MERHRDSLIDMSEAKDMPMSPGSHVRERRGSAADAMRAAAAAAAVSAAGQAAATIATTGPLSYFDGAASMQNFVQTEMTSILRPLAETIGQLEERIDELASSGASAHALIADITTRLERHETALESDSGTLASIRSEIGSIANELKGLDYHDRRLKELEEYAGVTKESFLKNDNRMDVVVVDVQALQQGLDESESARHKVELKLWQTTNLAQRLETCIGDQKEQHSLTLDRYHGVIRSLQQLQDALDNARGVSDKIQCSLDAHKVETNREFTECRGQMENHAGLIKQANASWQSHIDRVSSEQNELKTFQYEMKGDLLALRRKVQNHVEAQDNMAKIEHDKQAALHAFAETIELRVNELKKIATERLSRVEREIGLGGEAMYSATASPKAGCDDVDKVNIREAVRHHHTQQRHMQEALAKLEERCQDVISRLRDVSDYSEHNVIKLISTADSHRQVIDQHSEEITSLSKNTTKCGQDIDGASWKLQSLHLELGMTSEAVAKIAQHLDLAHDYLHGFGKGLQETQRRVSRGLDSIIPQKRPGSGKPLPTLHPTAPVEAAPRPRPVSAGLVGRCAPKGNLISEWQQSER
eukprot:TRINITY_DN10642_c0_g1_i1.p1 TRINITY_DN10642_c0_g1~~TRINITY_DN10642_c0_g1_i1.p1  ORF type:complete len:588 (+),score=124.12 TRINITY_DN10642_c0_g1_i1:157-1920(+)